MFSSALVCLLAGLRKNYSTELYFLFSRFVEFWHKQRYALCSCRVIFTGEDRREHNETISTNNV